MDYDEVLKRARANMNGACASCPVCNGVACGNRIPGPGAKGTGDVARRNFSAWADIRVNMDTLVENEPADTTAHLFGRTFAAPVFAGPVGAVATHYGDVHNDVTYNNILVPACAKAGIAAFTGDGVEPTVMQAATAAIRASGGAGVPTVKPWDPETIVEKLQLVRDAGAFAVAMDVDAAGLPFLKNLEPPAGRMTAGQLAAIIASVDVPFIVKGIMTPKGALKAAEAGAAAVIVSNHGGRVLDQCPATAEMLPEIVSALEGGDVRVLVDGGIRTGVDVFKALAMGASGALIARPFVNAVYGGAAEGVGMLASRYISELSDTMEMCGAHSLAEISPDMVRLP
ncbi:alpha-hydroxy-acid oxidizing protein [Curtanaerobium respiraculi]|uniref:alpha-hydroxy-acid oxidizing protein n=1 Tax=Curtanaerobium respiraculi TaxID=2949669 RepID=UPI0024B38F14|nr:alpha-hydroxy-acid oxidizing protein [Curtanaerobium respiraculi]